MRRWIASLVLSLGLTGVAGVGAGCNTNPATGRSQFNMLSESQELDLGKKAEPEFLSQYGGEIPDRQIQQYVTDLGQRLAKASERPTLPWEFHVVDSSVINAFALPGGKVFISRGLLARMNNEAQLAGVLGHEIGHVTAQHIGQQMTRQMGLQAVGSALGVAAGASSNAYLQVLGAGTQVGSGLYLLSFGRNQESQADELGMRYMSRLNYNPRGQLEVMKILKAEAEGQARQPEFLSTHPLPESRIDRIKKILADDYPRSATNSRYEYAPDRFRTQVLDRLASLPPPKHTGQETAAGGKGLRARRR